MRRFRETFERYPLTKSCVRQADRQAKPGILHWCRIWKASFRFRRWRFVHQEPMTEHKHFRLTLFGFNCLSVTWETPDFPLHFVQTFPLTGYASEVRWSVVCYCSCLFRLLMDNRCAEKKAVYGRWPFIVSVSRDAVINSGYVDFYLKFFNQNFEIFKDLSAFCSKIIGISWHKAGERKFLIDVAIGKD